jgi:hypothetical protein
VNDDLLALEGGIEVRDDAHLPSRGVRLALTQRDRKRLRRRSVLTTLVEGAAVELFLRLGLEFAALRPRAVRAFRRDDDGAPRERVAPKFGRQVSDPP